MKTQLPKLSPQTPPPPSPADPSRPHPLELLGRKLVLWCDGGGAWRCNEDACPHRLAPLSEGRLDGGELECSYHGARGGGGGSFASV